MDILQMIDPNNAIWIGVICGLLCIVGVVILIFLQFLGAGLGIIFSLLELLGSIIAGGPVAWCGCLIAVFGCSICGFLSINFVSVVQSCGTPDALRICRFLGY